MKIESNAKTEKIVSSSNIENIVPSEVLTEEKLREIASYLPVEVLFSTDSFAYWQNHYINTYGYKYLEVFRTLENDNQRFIVFCWVLRTKIFEWNHSIFEHEKTLPFRKFSEEDWNKANNTILYLATTICIC